jgi:hypothetical protein
MENAALDYWIVENCSQGSPQTTLEVSYEQLNLYLVWKHI